MAAVLCCLLTAAACKKQLDIKPSSSLQVPSSAADFQALLDNTDIFNSSWPIAGTAGADDGLILDATLASAPLTVRNGYVWNRDVFNENVKNDWSLPYTAIFYANVVLEGVAKYGTAGNADWDNIRGQAAFFRAYAYWQLAQEFCRPYDAATASADPGLVIRDSSDLNVPSVRSTVAAAYGQVTADLQAAVRLLPVHVVAKTRPGKAAAYAMFARTYLSMRDYKRSADYADSALALNSTLMDYNSISPAAGVPFKRFNDEVIFHAGPTSYSNLQSPKYLVDTVLYASYDAADLRGALFFSKATANKYQNFRGSYDGSSKLFGGLATDELFLIRAEGRARTGDLGQALADLNQLRKNRYLKATYSDLTAADGKTVLGWVLEERRKELLLRGLRWSDLRRLNTEPDYQQTLVRVAGGIRYELPPGDPRYVWPIPLVVIAQTGIAQNP